MELLLLVLVLLPLFHHSSYGKKPQILTYNFYLTCVCSQVERALAIPSLPLLQVVKDFLFHFPNLLEEVNHTSLMATKPKPKWH